MVSGHAWQPQMAVKSFPVVVPKAARDWLYKMRSGRFRPSERLKSRTDFSQVFDNPEKLSGKPLLILWKPGKAGCARLGVIASKRVSRLAVSRNRIRRVIRDSFRHAKETLGQLDIIIIARHPCAGLSKSELRKETDILWQRLQRRLRKSSLS